jgi:hypothetical protein
MANGESDVWKWLAGGVTTLFTAVSASHLRTRDRVTRLEEGHTSLRKQAILQQETRDTVIRLTEKVGALEDDMRESINRLERDISLQAVTSLDIKQILQRLERHIGEG